MNINITQLIAVIENHDNNHVSPGALPKLKAMSSALLESEHAGLLVLQTLEPTLIPYIYEVGNSQGKSNEYIYKFSDMLYENAAKAHDKHIEKGRYGDDKHIADAFGAMAAYSLDEEKTPTAEDITHCISRYFQFMHTCEGAIINARKHRASNPTRILAQKVINVQDVCQMYYKATMRSSK